MSDFGAIFADPLSVMVLSTVTIALIVAHAMAISGSRRTASTAFPIKAA